MLSRMISVVLKSRHQQTWNWKLVVAGGGGGGYWLIKSTDKVQEFVTSKKERFTNSDLITPFSGSCTLLQFVINRWTSLDCAGAFGSAILIPIMGRHTWLTLIRVDYSRLSFECMFNDWVALLWLMPTVFLALSALGRNNFKTYRGYYWMVELTQCSIKCRQRYSCIKKENWGGCRFTTPIHVMKVLCYVRTQSQAI